MSEQAPAKAMPEVAWPLMAAKMLEQLEWKWASQPTNIILPRPFAGEGE